MSHQITDPKPGWYIDSSVLLHAILGTDDKAIAWFKRSISQGQLTSSSLLRLEVVRTLRREGLSLSMANPFLNWLYWAPIGEDVLNLAASLPGHVKSLDAIHLATLSIIDPTMTLITHDRMMTTAAIGMGVDVMDPLSEN
ncbi:MAG: hypothetical protein LBM23_07235 [Propionibacteriaceae bacterium]|jgi:predicted nucleic acid-binding protein|nr:hypothetical protein [Propionibacteriaceae bacterium]